MSKRAVLDTSTLVSAALRKGSIPHQAFLEALTTCEICASAETLTELDTVLARSKFDSYLNREARREFISLVRRHAHVFVVREENLSAVMPGCRDPGDNQFLALAMAVGAEVLVSSDSDLLVLHPWRGIDIVTPKDFLNRSRLLAGSTKQPDV